MADEPYKQQAPRIEGGVDAIVIGASPDALAAAALLGRAGHHVVLIDTSDSRASERREFAAGYFTDGGDPFAAMLDRHVVEQLDLYRHGLSFSARRLETLVRFSDGAGLTLPADPDLAGEAVGAFSSVDRDVFTRLWQQERKTAREVADWFSGGEKPAIMDASAIAASVEGNLAGRFADSRLEDYLMAEAALHSAVSPREPFGYLTLLRRLSGEAAGLQGGVAMIEQGARGLSQALRRACQAAGVAIRQTDRASRIIVEWDRVAGVAFDDAAQIRAPMIISALGARQTFLDMVGRARLEIEFTRALDLPAPPIARARLNIALAGEPIDAAVLRDLRRRFLFAPTPLDLDYAFRAAAKGANASCGIAEIAIPSAFDPTLAPAGSATASLVLHPVSSARSDDAAWREGLAAYAAKAFRRTVGAFTVATVDIEAIDAASPPIAATIEMRELMAHGAAIEGLFFCGPEACLASGQSLAAGKRAADDARRYFRAMGDG